METSLVLLVIVEIGAVKYMMSRQSMYNAWDKVMAHQVAEYAALAQVPPSSGETYSSVGDA